MNNLFDLNIEIVLEHWGVEHAIREIIANAIDEQTLTDTSDFSVTYSNKVCRIRDYGRGIQYKHFTQNENKEKLAAANLIGKFGVGLKDALGVFHRHNVSVTIHSKYATITLEMTNKKGFDIKTLHAAFGPPQYPNMVGTEFILENVTESDVQNAKNMFLRFNDNVSMLERTAYGEVYLNNDNSTAVIYANGVQIAFEENFMFSYNITNINAQMKKALNRERSHVGRTAYSDTIKNIIKNCKSDAVLRSLVKDITNVMTGNNKDETGWVDIAAYAAKTLNKSGNVVFMTPWQRAALTNPQVEMLLTSGKELIMVNDAVYGKISNDVSTFSDVEQIFRDNFNYTFVKYESLSIIEKDVFDTHRKIISLLIKKYKISAPTIKISETICADKSGSVSLGVWDSDEGAIIVKRSVLQDKEKFYGVLMHEFGHYSSGYEDNTRDFENVLTDMLGFIYSQLSLIESVADNNKTSNTNIEAQSDKQLLQKKRRKKLFGIF